MRGDAVAGHVSPGIRKLRNFAITVAVMASVLLIGCQAMVRSSLFYPTHADRDNGLARWMHAGALIGYAVTVADPENIWLLLHGNGGQASDRTYLLDKFSGRDSVFILEYPGYGTRPGKPSRKSFDAAALQAYELLRARFPGKPVCVVGESIGSGPGSALARAAQPPDKIVLLVPFDALKSVARGYVPYLPASLILAGSWDNIESLSGYTGPIEVFGAEGDTIIPVTHARRLAESLPQAKFHLLPGGHMDWVQLRQVQIRNP